MLLLEGRGQKMGNVEDLWRLRYWGDGVKDIEKYKVIAGIPMFVLYLSKSRTLPIYQYTYRTYTPQEIL